MGNAWLGPLSFSSFIPFVPSARPVVQYGSYRRAPLPPLPPLPLPFSLLQHSSSAASLAGPHALVDAKKIQSPPSQTPSAVCRSAPKKNAWKYFIGLSPCNTQILGFTWHFKLSKPFCIVCGHLATSHPLAFCSVVSFPLLLHLHLHLTSPLHPNPASPTTKFDQERAIHPGNVSSRI
ncbi:hypothetical protein BKA61DRAFT_355549 [Leptodontidium sp. MPI-SDFR-AT-0119]|nr:hypothetical protein BKA61DRAFT_355549 [Leptodontidium sp. MPI-SDFR-AT-0119]